MKFKIRTQLTIRFTIIVALILILFSVLIYSLFASYRKTSFYSRLEDKAISTARLLIEEKGIDYQILKIINRYTLNSPYNEKLIIYNIKNEQIYNSSDNDLVSVSNSLIEKIRQKKIIRFRQGKYEAIGLLHTEKDNSYVVIISALDKSGRSKLGFLKWVMACGLLISIGLTLFIGNIFSKRALKPMLDVVNQVDGINISNLHLRVKEESGTDEISHLAITFNQMLDRLESAFEMQESFVSNASHELRTPLTSMMGHIEVALMKSRPAEEYKNILESVLDDIKNLIKLTNGLLDLAKVSSDQTVIAFSKLRFDEILLETKDELVARNNDYHISFLFDESIDDEQKLMIFGSRYLLKTAIANLADNACKFSADHTAEIKISITENFITAKFIDNGIGINPADLKNVFNPFFRASNAKNISGFGLGLSLTQKIIQLHKGTISIKSRLEKGTEATINIPLLT